MITTDNQDLNEKYILPNGDAITISELVDLYKEHQRIPFPAKANIDTIDKVAKSCRITWSFNNLDRVEEVKFVTNNLINYNNSNDLIESIEELPGIAESGTELGNATSETGQYRVCISKSNGKDSKNGDSSINQRIDIWDLNENTILKSIDVNSQTKHGPIYLALSNLSFSPNENQVIYVAEKKVKSESYFREDNLFKDDSKKDDSKTNEATVKGNEYEFRQDWGEQTDALKHTVICILTFKPELKLKIVDLPDFTPFSPFFINDSTIGFCALKETPKRLGFIYCTNRVTRLYKCKLAGTNNEEKDEFEVIKGENDDLYISNAQINSQKNKVVFFENQAGGPHNGAQRLCIWDLKTNKISIVFKDFEDSQPIIKSLFFSDNKLPNYWLMDGENIVLSTYHHSKEILFVLNIINKKLNIIDFGLEDMKILNLKNDLLVISASSPNQPPVVKIGFLNPKNSSNLIEFKQLRAKFTKKNSEISYRIIKQNEDKVLDQIETIVVGQTDTFNKPSPLIFWPHGGPHAVSLAMYHRTISFFVKLGFKVALINYRGSLGINKDYVNQLCGNVSDMDVKDCSSSINNLINLNLIDKNNINLIGGSHGGFLVCNLIGQYPDFNFSSCVAINPVTDISKMFTITDIADWCLVESIGINIETYKKLNNWPEESNLCKQLNRIIDVGNTEVMKTMFDKSPIKYIDNVKTPVLMMLGQIDKRVPYYQGLSFINALKVRKVETKCYLYQDNHSIGKLAHHADLIINSTKWILKNFKR